MIVVSKICLPYIQIYDVKKYADVFCVKTTNIEVVTIKRKTNQWKTCIRNRGLIGLL